MKPLDDYSFVRGVCHNPSSNRSQEELEKQLGFCQRLKINSIRFWMKQSEFEKDPEDYIERIGNFMRTCGKYDISCMPIFWNGNFIEEFNEPTEAEYSRAYKYAEAVIEEFKDEDFVLMWDVINEPMCNDYMHKSPSQEKETRYAKLKRYVRRLCNIILDIDPDNCLTVGHEDIDHCQSTVDLVDVISYHDYSTTRAKMEETILQARELGKKWDKPILNTETGCIARANPYDIELELADKYNIGWYLFNLVAEGFWGDIHGSVYPDGTIRDASAIAALFGFYRNRSKDRIKANPNKEGHAYKAVKAVEDALRVEPTTIFQSKDKTTDDILEAAEYCVNLLEAADMVPKWDAPSARIEIWRNQPAEERDMHEIKKFAYEMAQILKKKCYF